MVERMDARHRSNRQGRRRGRRSTVPRHRSAASDHL